MPNNSYEDFAAGGSGNADQPTRAMEISPIQLTPKSKPMTGVTHQPVNYQPQPQQINPQPVQPQGQQYQQPFAAYPQPMGSTYTSVVGRPPASGGMIAVAWIIAILSLGYMLPWAIAVSRNKSDQGTIGLINFFLGWSIVGWWAALIMACVADKANTVVVNHYNANVNGPYR